MPVTLLEALSVGCIPICSPVGGIPEVINNGEDGFLSSDPSEEAYYNVLCRFLQCTETDMYRIKMNCLESFQKYRITEVAKSYINVYQTKPYE